MSTTEDKIEVAASTAVPVAEAEKQEAPTTAAKQAEEPIEEEADGEEEGEEEIKPVAELLEEAKRNYALRKWSEAADGYGQALDGLREQYPDDAPLLAPLQHRYGHALLEYAIATSGALGGSGSGGGAGKEAPMPSRSGNASTVATARAKDTNGSAAKPASGEASSSSSSKAVDGAASGSASATKPHDPRFTFGGDAEESDEEEEAAAAQQQGDGEDDDGDDLGDAFSVLEVARVRYESLLEQGATLTTIDGDVWDAPMLKAQLAEVLNDLADVGLESENFQQASSDYKLALELLQPLLQPHSRRLADAYLRLGLALEFHPDAAMQASAESYVTAACMVMRKRAEVLSERTATLERDREGGEAGLAQIEASANEARMEKVAEESAARLEQEGVLAPKESSMTTSNGKGKATAPEPATATRALEKDDVVVMDWQAVKKETAEIREMIQELELKLEEYANAPPGATASGGPDMAGLPVASDTRAALQQAINEALLGGSTNAIANGGASAFGARATDPNAPINDLSAMVKRKKPAPAQAATAEESNGKRKEIGEPSASGVADEQATSKRARVEDA